MKWEKIQNNQLSCYEELGFKSVSIPKITQSIVRMASKVNEKINPRRKPELGNPYAPDSNIDVVSGEK